MAYTPGKESADSLHIDIPTECSLYCCSDLENYTLSDFQQLPNDALPLVSNKTIFEWALKVHELWNHLSKQACYSPKFHDTKKAHFYCVICQATSATFLSSFNLHGLSLDSKDYHLIS